MHVMTGAWGPADACWEVENVALGLRRVVQVGGEDARAIISGPLDGMQSMGWVSRGTPQFKVSTDKRKVTGNG